MARKRIHATAFAQLILCEAPPASSSISSTPYLLQFRTFGREKALPVLVDLGFARTSPASTTSLERHFKRPFYSEPRMKEAVTG
jgi:hypothetical protein